MPDRYFVTGGAGFIGSNFVRGLLDDGFDVTNLDAMTYAGVPATIAELDASPAHTFIHGDIRDGSLLSDILPGHDVVVHFAAESHVDRSIDKPHAFLDTNVVGTGNLIEAAMHAGVPRFVHISTDEVYGPILDGAPDEEAPLKPSSPYSASKAGSDLLALSYGVTHDYDVVVTRCTNNFGPYQFPEKVIPLFVTNLMQGEPVPVYGDGAAQRDWLHVEDHCRAVRLVADSGSSGEIYNIGADAQLSNLELTKRLLDLVGRDESFIHFVEDRPGHDMRYAVDSSKIHGLGWKPESSLDDRLEETVQWYRTRRDWWEPLRRVA